MSGSTNTIKLGKQLIGVRLGMRQYLSYVSLCNPKDLQATGIRELAYFCITWSLCSDLRKYPREIGQLINML